MSDIREIYVPDPYGLNDSLEQLQLVFNSIGIQYYVIGALMLGLIAQILTTASDDPTKSLKPFLKAFFACLILSYCMTDTKLMVKKWNPSPLDDEFVGSVDTKTVFTFPAYVTEFMHPLFRKLKAASRSNAEVPEIDEISPPTLLGAIYDRFAKVDLNDYANVNAWDGSLKGSFKLTLDDYITNCGLKETSRGGNPIARLAAAQDAVDGLEMPLASETFTQILGATTYEESCADAFIRIKAYLNSEQFKTNLKKDYQQLFTKDLVELGSYSRGQDLSSISVDTAYRYANNAISTAVGGQQDIPIELAKNSIVQQAIARLKTTDSTGAPDFQVVTAAFRDTYFARTVNSTEFSSFGMFSSMPKLFNALIALAPFFLIIGGLTISRPLFAISLMFVPPLAIAVICIATHLAGANVYTSIANAVNQVLSNKDICLKTTSPTCLAVIDKTVTVELTELMNSTNAIIGMIVGLIVTMLGLPIAAAKVGTSNLRAPDQQAVTNSASDKTESGRPPIETAAKTMYAAQATVTPGKGATTDAAEGSFSSQIDMSKARAETNALTSQATQNHAETLMKGYSSAVSNDKGSGKTIQQMRDISDSMGISEQVTNTTASNLVDSLDTKDQKSAEEKLAAGWGIATGGTKEGLKGAMGKIGMLGMAKLMMDMGKVKFDESFGSGTQQSVILGKGLQQTEGVSNSHSALQSFMQRISSSENAQSVDKIMDRAGTEEKRAYTSARSAAEIASKTENITESASGRMGTTLNTLDSQMGQKAIKGGFDIDKMDQELQRNLSAEQYKEVMNKHMRNSAQSESDPIRQHKTAVVAAFAESAVQNTDFKQKILQEPNSEGLRFMSQELGVSADGDHSAGAREINKKGEEIKDKVKEEHGKGEGVSKRAAGETASAKNVNVSASQLRADMNAQRDDVTKKTAPQLNNGPKTPEEMKAASNRLIADEKAKNEQQKKGQEAAIKKAEAANLQTQGANVANSTPVQNIKNTGNDVLGGTYKAAESMLDTSASGWGKIWNAVTGGDSETPQSQTNSAPNQVPGAPEGSQGSFAPNFNYAPPSTTPAASASASGAQQTPAAPAPTQQSPAVPAGGNPPVANTGSAPQPSASVSPVQGTQGGTAVTAAAPAAPVAALRNDQAPTGIPIYSSTNAPEGKAQTSAQPAAQQSATPPAPPATPVDASRNYTETASPFARIGHVNDKKDFSLTPEAADKTRPTALNATAQAAKAGIGAVEKLGELIPEPVKDAAKGVFNWFSDRTYEPVKQLETVAAETVVGTAKPALETITGLKYTEETKANREAALQQMGGELRDKASIESAQSIMQGKTPQQASEINSALFKELNDRGLGPQAAQYRSQMPVTGESAPVADNAAILRTIAQNTDSQTFGNIVEKLGGTAPGFQYDAGQPATESRFNPATPASNAGQQPPQPPPGPNPDVPVIASPAAPAAEQQGPRVPLADATPQEKALAPNTGTPAQSSAGTVAQAEPPQGAPQPDKAATSAEPGAQQSQALASASPAAQPVASTPNADIPVQASSGSAVAQAEAPQGALQSDKAATSGVQGDQQAPVVAASSDANPAPHAGSALNKEVPAQSSNGGTVAQSETPQAPQPDKTATSGETQANQAPAVAATTDASAPAAPQSPVSDGYVPVQFTPSNTVASVEQPQVQPQATPEQQSPQAAAKPGAAKATQSAQVADAAPVVQPISTISIPGQSTNSAALPTPTVAQATVPTQQGNSAALPGQQKTDSLGLPVLQRA